MKDSGSIGRSNKKAGARSAKLSCTPTSSKRSNGTTDLKSYNKRIQKAKAIMGGLNSKSNPPPKSSSRKTKKQSLELRPRRRASQTYFFKYQLARNPLKAEEEDLKQALIASLQQCNNGSSETKSKKSNKLAAKNKKSPSSSSTPSKQIDNKDSKPIHPPSPDSKKPVGRPPKKENSVLADNSINTSQSQYLMHYSPYTPLQRKEPPDEDYLKKYKPETEDFLTFICFRTTASTYLNQLTNETTINGAEETNCTTISDHNTGNNRLASKQTANDSNNLKLFNYSLTTKSTNINGSPSNNAELCSPNNHRRPTRQSPRLANSSRKISENDSLNHAMSTSATAYDNSISYEEDMKRASIALEDMAQEINSSDDINNEVAQDSQDCISKKSSSPYKNNKHLVKGLMTREFAGAFADEETIFESISNHKL